MRSRAAQERPVNDRPFFVSALTVAGGSGLDTPGSGAVIQVVRHDFARRQPRPGRSVRHADDFPLFDVGPARCHAWQYLRGCSAGTI
jgi:hypothetical protein